MDAANETLVDAGGANLWLVAENAVRMAERSGCLDSVNLTDRCLTYANATDEDDFNTFYFYQVIYIRVIPFISMIILRTGLLYVFCMRFSRKAIHFCRSLPAKCHVYRLSSITQIISFQSVNMYFFGGAIRARIKDNSALSCRVAFFEWTLIGKRVGSSLPLSCLPDKRPAHPR